MSVKVVIDREVRDGKESEFSNLMRELRKKAITSKSYISGETLRSSNDPYNYIVISTWRGIDDWKDWEKNPARKDLQARIEKLMARPTKVQIYMNA